MNLSLYQRFIGLFTGKRLLLVLGSAFSTGSQVGRNEGERHAFLAYVWDKESNAPSRVLDALEQSGWRMPQIDQCKRLTLPFENLDHAHINAFHAAVRGDVGVIIYSND